jgi:PAS domain S-box-containing protein
MIAFSSRNKSLAVTLIGFGFLYFVFAWGAVVLARLPGSIANLWVANAIGVAYLVVQPTSRALPILCIAAVADFLANLAWGDSVLLSLAFSPANCLEMAIAAWLIRKTDVQHNFDETPTKFLLFIALASLVPSLIGATVGAWSLSYVGYAPINRIWPVWYAAKTIGSVAMLPIALLAAREDPALLLKRIGVFRLTLYSGLTVVMTIVASLYLPSPFVYVMAVLIGAAVTLPFEGVAFLVCIASLSSAALTSPGYFRAPPNSPDWHVLLFYLSFLLTLIPPLLLAASLNQARLRKQAREQFERSLERSNVKLQTIIDQLPAMIGYWDTGLKNRFSNRSYFEWFGFSADEMRGLSLQDVLDEKSYSQSLPYVYAALAGKASTFERVITNLHGEMRHTLASYVPDMTPAGQIAGFYSFLTDVTPLKSAQQAETNARAQLQSIIDAASEFAIIATDLDGIINVFNSGAERMLGYRCTEMIGLQTPIAFLVAEEVEAYSALLSASYGKAISGYPALVERARLGHAESREWQFVRKNGLRVPVSLVFTATYDRSGIINGFLGVANNISGQRQLQASLITARDASEAASRAKSAFVANMSHEIRTPMNAVLGITRLLAETELSTIQQSYLDMISDAGQSLLSILNDILDFSKIEAGRMELSPTPFLLADLLDSVAAIMLVTAREKQLALDFQIAPDVPPALIGDATRLQQILINLTGNAVKFTASGSVSVSVTTAPQESLLQDDTITLRFCVQDTGIGIDSQQQARLFSAFSQADASITRRFGGSGLGLVICKRLVELMDGRISVASTLGQGSEFCITLPMQLAGEQDTVEARTSPVAPVAPRKAVKRPRLDGVTLLLVEDNALNQMVARMSLEHAGAKVIVVDDGLQALESLRAPAYPFDLVLMDVQMPVMDGFTATRMIRHELGLAIPVLAMTAGVMASEQAQCLAAGMDDFIAKPLDIDQMFNIIMRHLPTVPASSTTHILSPSNNSGIFNIAYLHESNEKNQVAFDLQTALVTSILDHAKLQLIEVRQALANGEYDSTAKLLHTLRSTVGSLGANRFANAALLLETVLRLGQRSNNSARLLAVMEEEFDRTLAAAQIWLDGRPQIGSQHQPISVPVNREILSTLRRMLTAHDLAALELYAEIRASLRTKLDPENMLALDSALERLDFDHALNSLPQEHG